MDGRALPPLDFLNQCLTYDAVNGTLTWKARPLEHFKNESRWKCWNTRFAGKTATKTAQDGYLMIKIKKNYRAHRIAWTIYNNQTIPEKIDIDHIDGDKTNNSAANLRLATNGQNQGNSRKPRNNTTGFKGVSINKECPNRPFKSSIGGMINGKRFSKTLGQFATPEEAHAAYVRAANQYFGEYARGK